MILRGRISIRNQIDVRSGVGQSARTLTGRQQQISITALAAMPSAEALRTHELFRSHGDQRLQGMSSLAAAASRWDCRFGSDIGERNVGKKNDETLDE